VTVLLDVVGRRCGVQLLSKKGWLSAGLSTVSSSHARRGNDRHETTRRNVQEFDISTNAVWKNTGRRTRYHHTAPDPRYVLRCVRGLRLILEKGWRPAGSASVESSRAQGGGLTAHGFSYVAGGRDGSCRSECGASEAASMTRGCDKRRLEQFNIEIAAGPREFKGKVGHRLMGYNRRPANVCCSGRRWRVFGNQGRRARGGESRLAGEPPALSQRGDHTIQS